MQTANSKQQTAIRIRSRINQLDPQLDLNWQADLLNLVQQLPEAQRNVTVEQLAKNRKIEWNAGKGRFTYKIPTNCVETPDFIEDETMRALAMRVQKALTLLSQYQTAEQIAQAIEAIILEIEKFDTADDMSFKRWKQRILQDFAYAVVKYIQTVDEIQMGKNTRYLNAKVFKTYIAEVYLKQRLKGYFFKTMRQRDILEHEQLKNLDFLLPEKKSRQLELVLTSEYLFAVAPSYHFGVNPYSLLKFLNEETFAHAGTVYFNVAYIKLEHLHHNETIEFFKWQLSRIITIQKSIRPEIVDTVDLMEQNIMQYLVPLLEQPLDVNTMQIDAAIEKRLFEFEQALTIYVLTPLKKVLTQVANHQDEYEYLYISIQSLMGDILNQLQDFQNQPITLFNKHIERFIARVNAYALFLVKRHAQLFVTQDENQWQIIKAQAEQPITELKALLSDASKNYRSLTKQRREIEREQQEYQPSFFAKILGKKRDFDAELKGIDVQVQKMNEQDYIEIIRYNKKQKQHLIYIEFETESLIDDKYRHYAYVVGEYGIGRLPILMILTEQRESFNLFDLNKQIENDLHYVTQRIIDRVNDQQRLDIGKSS